MRNVYASRIQTPDGTILHSHHRHDYVVYTDTESGEFYMLDGGRDYMRSSVNQIPAKNISVYTDDLHEIKRCVPVWGTRGKHGDESFKYIAVAEMTADHIDALLELDYIDVDIRDCILDEIKYREKLLFTGIHNSSEFTIENAHKAFVGELA